MSVPVSPTPEPRRVVQQRDVTQNDAGNAGLDLDLRAVSSPTPDSSDGERCAECGGANIVWFTDSALWNEVIGRDRSPILCPQCFVAKAEALQRPTAWSLQPEARPSPTPDEQAAEEVAKLKRDLEDMTADRDSWEQQTSDVLASWSDTNADLVVVREQLTQAEARNDAVRRLCEKTLRAYWKNPFGAALLAVADVERAAGIERKP